MSGAWCKLQVLVCSISQRVQYTAAYLNLQMAFRPRRPHPPLMSGWWYRPRSVTELVLTRVRKKKPDISTGSPTGSRRRCFSAVGLQVMFAERCSPRSALLEFRFGSFPRCLEHATSTGGREICDKLWTKLGSKRGLLTFRACRLPPVTPQCLLKDNFKQGQKLGAHFIC